MASTMRPTRRLLEDKSHTNDCLSCSNHSGWRLWVPHRYSIHEVVDTKGDSSPDINAMAKEHFAMRGTKLSRDDSAHLIANLSSRWEERYPLFWGSG